MSEIQSRTFLVCDEPHCAWGWDLTERNNEFIEKIDGEYFQYIVESHVDQLETDHAQHAAIVLRTNYYLCLETMFGLVGASLQAPDFAVGWVLKASNHQIRRFVESLKARKKDFLVKWVSSDLYLDFSAFAGLIFQYTTWAQDPSDKTIERMSLLLERFAQDFLEPAHIREYNSIKHGMRIHKGGFHLAVGIEHEYGVPPPPEEMKALGGSKFGTSCVFPEHVDGAPEVRGDRHFKLNKSSVNWSAEATAQKLWLAAMAVDNLKSFLQVANGKAPGTSKFFRPEDPEGYDAPWKWSVGVNRFSSGPIVHEHCIYRASKAEIIENISRAIKETDQAS